VRAILISVAILFMSGPDAGPAKRKPANSSAKNVCFPDEPLVCTAF